MLGSVRTVHTEPPAEQGVRDGLAYALFLPAGDPAAGGVVVIHGAGSQKENHFDFARECRAAGLAAVAFEQRGHGASAGARDGGAIDDVATVAGLLPGGVPVALRRSSMGGWLARARGAAPHAAAGAAGRRGGAPAPGGGRGGGGGRPPPPAAAGRAPGARPPAPASSDQLARGLRSGRFTFRAAPETLEPLLRATDLAAAARTLGER